MENKKGHCLPTGVITISFYLKDPQVRKWALMAVHHNIKLGMKALVIYYENDKIKKYEWLYNSKQLDDLEMSSIAD